jgi:hypothetical protein
MKLAIAYEVQSAVQRGQDYIAAGVNFKDLVRWYVTHIFSGLFTCMLPIIRHLCLLVNEA